MSHAAAFTNCIEGGGVAVFPADTVYGLACDPGNADAVARLYALKGRAPDKPAAVMWFETARALGALSELGARTRAAVERLTPGGVTLLLPNPAGRFPLAGGGAVLGVRIPDVPLLAAVPLAVLQSSANHAGAADARTLDDVPEEIRDGADLVLDGGRAGPLPGTPSTVVDLRDFEAEGRWQVVREGAVPAAELARALAKVSGPP